MSLTDRLSTSKFASGVFALALLSIAAQAQSAVITSRKITYERPKPLMDFKKTFTVNYPKVRAATPAVSRRIEQNISYAKLLGLNVREETNEIQWLEEADFEVCYNARGLLCITLFISGSGAYPSGTSKTVVVDLKSGNRIRPFAVFKDLPALASTVRNKQKLEIESAIAEIKKDPDASDVDPSQLFQGARFTIKDLQEFSIDDNGVVFIYDYNFPHVMKALQPDGRFTFSWHELRRFIKPKGPFEKFIIK